MSTKLEDLKPYVKFLAENFLAECKNKGINVLIVCTTRSVEEQNELYALGRSKPGQIVTNAKGGYSYHNYGLAFDCVPLTNGKANWNDINSYNKMGQIGKSIGLEWGGDFKSIKDLPHFQYSGGLDIKDLLAGKMPKFPEVPVFNTVDSSFTESIDVLKQKGVISSPDYWMSNNSYKGEYVRLLISKFALSIEINKNDEMKNILNEITKKGIINSPEYWLNNNEYKTEYVEELIKKFANYIKGKI